MFVCLIFVTLNFIEIVSRNDNTLLQVQIIFRHGDRTPDKFSLYPKDPYINDTWFPYGYSALTTLGKKQLYNLGECLRQRYDLFLGDSYSPEIQETKYTSFPRTKNSLQYVLAGLWSFNQTEISLNNPQWQLEYAKASVQVDELLISPVARPCKYYLEDYKRIESEEMHKILEKNKNKINYINFNTGLEIKTSFQLASLYHGLYAEEKGNKTLPEWTLLIYPAVLKNIAKHMYAVHTATPHMLKASSGPLIKDILSNAYEKINNSKKKLILYSGHDVNIAYTLIALKLFEEHIPDYAAYLTFELHKINEVHGFKIYYQDRKQKNMKLLKIPGCEEFCPLNQFEDLLKDVIPESSFQC